MMKLLKKVFENVILNSFQNHNILLNSNYEKLKQVQFDESALFRKPHV